MKNLLFGAFMSICLVALSGCPTKTQTTTYKATYCLWKTGATKYTVGKELSVTLRGAFVVIEQTHTGKVYIVSADDLSYCGDEIK